MSMLIALAMCLGPYSPGVCTSMTVMPGYARTSTASAALTLVAGAVPLAQAASAPTDTRTARSVATAWMRINIPPGVSEGAPPAHRPRRFR